MVLAVVLVGFGIWYVASEVQEPPAGLEQGEKLARAGGEGPRSHGISVEEQFGLRVWEPFGMEGAGRVEVLSVEAGGAADDAGLRSGDVILEVRGRWIARNSDLRNALRQAEPGALVLLVRRGNSTFHLTMNKQTSEE